MNRQSRSEDLSVPRINFDSAKALLILQGRCIPSDPESFFNPLSQLILDYIKRQGRIRCQIKLEYFNSSSAKELLSFLKLLKEQEKLGAIVSIEWFYEIDDEDSADFGKDLSDILQMPIEMIGLKKF